MIDGLDVLQTRTAPTDGYDAPNDVAIGSALAVLHVMESTRMLAKGLGPDRVVASAAEGVCFCWENERGRCADIECLNTGRILISIALTYEPYTEVWEINLTSRQEVQAALERIREWMRGGFGV